MHRPLPQTQFAVIAEALGSFVVVFVGAGTVCMGATTAGGMAEVAAALAAGVALGIMVVAIGPISGAHLHPAITLAALLAGRFHGRHAWRYVLAQVAGAAAAGTALRLLFPSALATLHLGAARAPAADAVVRTGIAEGAVTFAIVMAIAATLWRGLGTHVAAVATGCAQAVGALVVAPSSGAGGNPLRAFGPAFASGWYDGQLVYWVGPLAGAAAAALVGIALLPRPGRRGNALTLEREQPAEVSPPPAPTHSGKPTPAKLRHEVLYKEGLARYRAGLLVEAADFFSRVTECAPQWAEPYYYIGLIYRELGDKRTADKFFEAALYYRLEHAR